MVGDFNPLFHKRGDWDVEDRFSKCGPRSIASASPGNFKELRILGSSQTQSESAARRWHDPVLQVVLITSLRLGVTDVVIEPIDSQGQEH